MEEVKRGFIKALWGIHDHQGRRFYLRRTKIDNDINLCLHNKYQEPFTVYVFGEDNYKYLVDCGFKCKMLDKRPIVWDLDKQQFRHKFEVFKHAAEDFDEFVFTDWDMMFVNPLPKDFWEKMYEKEDIQAIMRIYKQRIMWQWRTESQRLCSCGSFIYIRRKEIANELINYWEKMGAGWGEEVVIAKYIDDKMGGKLDLEEYWRRFEPDYFKLQPIYSEDKMKTKIDIIQHFNARGVSWCLKRLGSLNWTQVEKRKYN